MASNPSFVALKFSQVAQHVGVGMAAASFWRGAWYVLDDVLYPDQPLESSLASLGLGMVGMGASQGLVAHCERLAAMSNSNNSNKKQKHTIKKYKVMRIPSLSLSNKLQVARFGALYSIAMSVVLIWRGTWMGWDLIYEHYHSKQHSQEVKATDPGHATHSGMLSHGMAIAVLAGTGLFASVLAPPAATCIIQDWSVRALGRQAAAASTSPFSNKVNSLLTNFTKQSTTSTTTATTTSKTVWSSEFIGPSSQLKRGFLSPTHATTVAPAILARSFHHHSAVGARTWPKTQSILKPDIGRRYQNF